MLYRQINIGIFFENVKGNDGLNQDFCSLTILPDKNSEF